MRPVNRDFTYSGTGEHIRLFEGKRCHTAYVFARKQRVFLPAVQKQEIHTFLTMKPNAATAYANLYFGNMPTLEK